MQAEKYIVTCKKCGGHDQLTITPERSVFYKENLPIISARFRPDFKWGFECTCGNDSRVALQEKEQLNILVRGGGHTIDKIAKSLTANSHLRFTMEQI